MPHAGGWTKAPVVLVCMTSPSKAGWTSCCMQKLNISTKYVLASQCFAFAAAFLNNSISVSDHIDHTSLSVKPYTKMYAL